ncbi:MAG: hypothetical protein H6713_13740 [Myxococcales bacterium]|nr:hypothetical protein [Myxococcales bacterium]
MSWNGEGSSSAIHISEHSAGSTSPGSTGPTPVVAAPVVSSPVVAPVVSSPVVSPPVASPVVAPPVVSPPVVSYSPSSHFLSSAGVSVNSPSLKTHTGGSELEYVGSALVDDALLPDALLPEPLAVGGAPEVELLESDDDAVSEPAVVEPVPDSPPSSPQLISSPANSVERHTRAPARVAGGK